MARVQQCGKDSLEGERRHVRALTREDLSEVASLYEHIYRSGSRIPSRKLGEYFARTLLDYPGRDPDIPSLVYENVEGRIVGFLGIQVRHLRFDGQPIRLACGGPLVTEPDARRRAAGGLLARRFLGGPQDLSISDGVNDVSRRVAAAGGAQTAYLGSIHWIRPFRPAVWANSTMLGERRPGWASMLRPLCRAADTAALGTLGQRLRPPEPDAVAEELTPAAMLETLPAVTRSFRCFPDYTEAFLKWVFDEMDQVAPRGHLIRSLVRNGRGQALGWYIYYLKPEGLCAVIQVAAVRGSTDAVVDHLFHHAHASGAGALEGRAEPHLLESLSQRRCLLRYHGGSIIHTRDSTLLAAALSRDCLLTYLEGESWMGPHLPLS